MPKHWDWPYDAPLTIDVPAQAITWEPKNTHKDALPDQPQPGQGAKTLTLIPYGCAKFRVSMFPVTPKAWGSDTVTLMSEAEKKALEDEQKQATEEALKDGVQIKD